MKYSCDNYHRCLLPLRTFHHYHSTASAMPIQSFYENFQMDLVINADEIDNEDDEVPVTIDIIVIVKLK